MTEVVKGTGVRLCLADEVPELAAWKNTSTSPEEREEAAAHRRGEIIYVARQVFVDAEDDGRPSGFTGSYGCCWPVRVDEDPTSDLLEVAEEARGNLGDLLGDLRIADADVTRWEFYAAPFRIELSTKLLERLGEAWRGREPRGTSGDVK